MMAPGGPRVLFAWEMGAGLGHLARIAPIAHALVERGVQVHLAAADLARAAAVLDRRVGLLACPQLGSARSAALPQYNYAALLARAGWLDAVALEGACRAWRSLFELVRPDVLVCDYAPTGLLASLGVPMRRCAIGNGFDLPPMREPLPAMSWWERFDDAVAARVEAAALQAANRALQAQRTAPLARLADLFACDWRAALTWPQLDVYPQRPPGDLEFTGIVDRGLSGVRPRWPSASRPRAFAYLRGERRFVQAAIGALQALGLTGLVCASGLDAAAAEALGTPAVQVSAEPVDLAYALAGADFVITHSGTGLGAQALCAGRPTVLLPQYREQLMGAVRLQALGVARYVLPDRLAELDAAVASIGCEPGAMRQAERFAQALPSTPQPCVHVVERLLALADARAEKWTDRAGQPATRVFGDRAP